MLQTVQIAGALPLAHGQVVEQIVATGLRARGWHLGLREDPLQALDGEALHIHDGVRTQHDDIHARETSHRTYVNHVVLGLAVAKPGGHEVLQAVHGSRGHGGFLIRLGDAQVECGEPLILA